MESVKSFMLSLFTLVFLFFGITFIVNVLCVGISMVIMIFYELFSHPKCPSCAKAIGKRTISCLYCGSALGGKPPQDEMNPELYARVKVFVAEQWSTSEEKLTPDTHLADDLGIAGDDGYELIEAFCEEFEIQNMSEIDPYEYFGPEGCNPFYVYILLYHWVFGREKLNDSYHSVTPLYLRDLVKSAEAKRWIPPEATS